MKNPKRFPPIDSQRSLIKQQIRGTIVSCIVLLLLVIGSTPSYGWSPFGPSNYQECVVEKMKGQDRSIIWRVEDACEIAFPYETEVSVKDENYLSWAWELRGSSRVALLITKNETVYKITRAKLLFFEGECNAVPTQNAKTAHADLVAPTFGSEFVAPVSSPGAYRCAAAKFWGKRRR